MRCIKRIGFIALAAAALVATLIGLTQIMTGDAGAQGMPATGTVRLPVVCKSFDIIKLHLAAEYGEAQAFAAAASGGAGLTIFLSTRGGWTAVLLRPGQPACVMMAGQGWSWLPLKEPGT